MGERIEFCEKKGMCFCFFNVFLYCFFSYKFCCFCRRSWRNNARRRQTAQTIEKEYSGGILEVKTQLLEVKILEGAHKGEIIKAQNSLNSFNDAYNITISKGQEVFVYINEGMDGTIESAYVAEIVRDKYILYLLIAFILSMLVVGRMKGFKALISLDITFFAVIYIMLPLFLKGYNPIIVSVPICVGVIVILFYW